MVNIITAGEMYDKVHSWMNEVNNPVQQTPTHIVNWFSRDKNWELVRVKEPESLSNEQLKKLSNLDIQNLTNKTSVKSFEILVWAEKNLY